MNKIYLIIIGILFSTIISAQTIVYHENFELPSLGDSLVTTADTIIDLGGGNTLNQSTQYFKPWAISTKLYKSGLRCDTNTLQPLKVIYLTSSSFSTVNNSYVILSFSQICKLHLADGGYVEVSNNNGATWTTLTAAQNQGGGSMLQNKFSELSYSAWLNGDTTTKPTNSWWKDEKFDISAFAANSPNVKIRFRYYTSGQANALGRYGWLIDDIKVTASLCELVPPTVNPFLTVEGAINTAGPYTISAYVRDASRIDSVYLQYKVGSNAYQNIKMTKPPTPVYPYDSVYTATIPFPGWGKIVNYRIIAIDSSCVHSMGIAPATGTYTFNTQYTGTGLPLDIGITQVNLPASGISVGTLLNVQANLKNFGTHLIKKATIYTSYNGVIHGSRIRLDSLVQNAVSPLILVDTISTLTTGPCTVKVWAEAPNDSLDQNSINDTASASFFVCSSLFNGNYTIGGTPGITNFPTFADAITGLTQCGISGPVVFNVAPGTYNEQLTLPIINGSSPTNTITFKAANGDSNSVILNFGTNLAAKNWIVNFNGASNFIFKNLSFTSGNVDSTLSNIFVFTNGASNNSLIGNVLIGRQGTTVNQALIRIQDTLCYNNKIIGNNLSKGYSSIYLQGTSSTKLIAPIEIRNNIISNFYGYGIFSEYAKPITIDGNTINSSIFLTNNYGIYLHYNYDSLKITKNKINITGAVNQYGLFIDNCHAGDTTKKGLVANNFISTLNGTTYTYGIRIINSDYQKIYFNSVYSTGSSLTDTRCINPVTSSFIELYNNNLQSNVYPIYVEQTSVSKADYNNYYSSGNYFAYWTGATYSTLASLKAATGKDVNSISTKPNFFSATDLHTINGLLKGAGKSFSEINVDIDGQPRLNPPCIGADEFLPTQKDAMLVSIVNPIGGCGLSTTENVRIIIRNIGTNVIAPSTINAVYKIGNSNPISPEVINRTINPGDTIHYIFNAKANLSVQTTAIDSTFNFQIWVNLTGDTLHYNDTLTKSFASKYVPISPLANDTLINYATSATLHATSTYPVVWYDVPFGGTSLLSSYNFNTPILYAKDTFYVEANSSNSLFGTIGNGTILNATSTYPSPYGMYYTGSKEQYLILASELTAQGLQAGPIQSCAFNVLTPTTPSSSGSAPSNTHLKDFSIKIGTTSLAALTTNYVSGLTQVYYNPMYTDTIGWNVHPFSSPFIWNGTSNIIIEACFDKWITDSDYGDNAEVYQTSTSFASSLYSHDDNPNQCGNTSGTTMNQRPNIMLNIGQLGCPSARKAVVVNVAPPPAVDAGLLAVTNPSGTLPSGVSQPIIVKLKNYGTSNLTSATINCKINGVLQSPVYNWTGNIAHDSIISVTIANKTFAGGLYAIQTWVSNPNGVSNTIASNDTAITSFIACLNGTYTIGDTTGGLQHDFPTFNSAVNALTIAGICGNVVFNVDTGTYNEQVLIPAINGTSINSTITFKAANGINTSAKLQYSTNATTNYYTLRLDGASNIIFKNLSLKALGTSYGRVIELVNGARNNTFDNNIIEMAYNNSTSLCGIYTYGSCDNTIITNNQIKKGYYSIYLYASATNHTLNNVIANNTITDFYYYGIYSYYQDSISIVKNTIKSDSTSNYIYGILTSYNNNIIGINKNTVDLRLPSGTAYGCYGIYNSYCNGTVGGYNLVSNNMVLLSGGNTSSNCYGIYPYYSNYYKYYFNTVKVNSASTGSVPLYHSGGTFIYITDNNLINSNIGYALNTATPTAIVGCDYNNYYTTDTNFVYWSGNRSTLNALITASGMNQHSVNVNSQFVSASNLHLQSTLLSGLGVAVPDVSDDIDGQIRSLTVPTIGADEVPMIPKDAGVIAVINPNPIETEASSVAVKIVIRNFGTDTIHNMSIKYKVNNGSAVNYNYVGNLANLATDTVLLPNMIVPAGNANICAYTNLIGDTNLFNDQYCKSFFGNPLFDAKLVTIVPIPGGCNLTSAKTVTIKIKNTGINNISGNLTASYKLIGSSNVINENVTAPILSGDTLSFIFTTPINLTVTTHDSTFLIKSWVTLLNDHIQTNDTANSSVTSLHTPPSPTASNVSIPYGTPVTLNANSATNDPIQWYVLATGGTQVYNGAHYSTPILYSNTTYYIESRTGFSLDNVVGNGTVQNTTTSYPTPYGNYFTGSKEQYLILASELSALGIPAGPIQSCGFNVITPTAPTTMGGAPSGSHLKNYTIKIGSTNQAALTTTYVSGLSQVYFNSHYIDNAGWNIHQFTTPYNWDGVSNIVVEVCHDNYVTTSDYGYQAVVNQTTTPFVSTTANYADAASQCGASGVYTYSQRPNIRLITNVAGCASSPRVPVAVTVNPQSAKDIGVTSIIAPVTDVNLLSNETVKAYITNFGSSPAYNFSAKYQINNGPVVSETVTDTILANAVKVYTFQTPANLGTVGDTFRVKAFISMVGDATPLNDTTTVYVINKAPVYCTSSALYTYGEDIGNVTFAGINNGNPSPQTNNPAAINLFTDYSNVAPGQIRAGVSYPISVSMIYSANTVSGTCNVYIDFNRNGTWETNEKAFSATYPAAIPQLLGNITVPFNAKPGLTKMRVVADEYNVAPACGTYTYGETEDYVVNIIPPIHHDAGISGIVKPDKFIIYNQTYLTQPKFVIKNYGIDTLSQATVYYKVNGNLSTYNWTKTPGLPSLTTDTFNIPSVFINDGLNTFAAYTSLPGDSNKFNDTTYRNVFKEYLSPIPYTDNFENDKFWFATDTNGGANINNLWQQGTPASSTINTAHSPVNAWKTLLNGNYPMGNVSILYSPKFHLAVNMGDTLRLWQWRHMGTQVYGRIEYLSVLNKWETLGSMGDANATNWYNSASGWTGTGTGWELSTYKISNLGNLGNYTQFRIIFDASASLVTDTAHNGWAIDDLDLNLVRFPLDAGVTQITTPGLTSVTGDSIAPAVVIKNFGLNPLTTMAVKYSVNYQIPITETWTGNLAPGTTTNYTFSHKYLVNPTNYILCASTGLSGDNFTLNDSSCQAVTVSPAANDVGVIAFISPSDSVPTSSTVTIKIRIKNFGTNPVTSVPVVYQRGASTPVTATWTGGPLNYGDTSSYTFTTTFTAPIGNSFNLCAWTAMVGDAYPLNNKLCKTAILLGVDDDFTADDLWLGQNRPNPTNGATTFNYNLPQAGVVDFKVTDLLGQVLYTKQLKENAGKHTLDYNVANLPDGVYYYSIEYKGKRLIKKMMISK